MDVVSGRDVRGFGWPTAVISLGVPAAVIAVGIVFPAVDWSRLPPGRPGPLLLPAAVLAIGIVALVLYGWRLRDLRREPFRPQRWERTHPFMTIGVILDWLAAKLGPAAVAFFVVALGSSWSIIMTKTSVGGATWHVFPGPYVVLIAFGASFTLAAIGGVAVRLCDRGAVFAGGRRRFDRELSKLIESDRNRPAGG